MTPPQGGSAPPPTPATSLHEAGPVTEIGPRKLFMAFSHLALIGFGGVLPVAYRVLVEQKQWLSPAEFAELLAVSQILPGPSICNIAVIIGHRFAGNRGAFAALAGMIVLPALLISLLGMLYQHYSDLQLVRQALGGMAVVAAGLIFSMGLKMVRVMPRTWLPMSFVALAFTGVGILRLPLLTVLGVLGVSAVVLAWIKGR